MATFALPEKATPVLEYPFLLRLKNALLAYCTYVGQTLWPEGLAVLYPHPLWLGWATPLAAAGFLAAATILSLRPARRRPALAAGWLWFLVVLLPAIGIVPISHHAMADRYTYLSMIGLTLAPAFTFPGEPGAVRVRAAIACASTVMLIAAVALTRTQVGFWQDSATLFRHALAVTPDNSIARLNLAAALAESGQGPEAVEHCRAAVRLDPGDHEVLTTCGSILADEGAEEEAFDHYRRALAIWPDSPAALNNLGALLSAQNRHLEAVSLLERAIALQPDLGKAYNNLGNALLQLGRKQEALERFRESVRLATRNPKAHYNLGNLLAGIGREEEAAAEYRLALEIDPGFADAWNNLGGLALGRGDLPLGRDYLRRAMELEPNNRAFRENFEAVQAADAGR